MDEDYTAEDLIEMAEASECERRRYEYYEEFFEYVSEYSDGNEDYSLYGG